MNRRNVLVGLGALAASAASLRAGALFRGIGAATTTTFAAGRFGLSLNNSFAGWMTKLTGGTAMVDPIGTRYIMKKQLAGFSYLPIALDCGAPIGKGLANALIETLQGGYPRLNGSVSTCDVANKEARALSFADALITRITFPQLGGGTEQLALSFSLAPESSQIVAGSGNVIGGNVSSVPKKWTGSAFKLVIDGTYATSAGKIDALVVEQNVIADAVGTKRDATKQPAQLTMPSLGLTTPLSTAEQPLIAWGQQFSATGGAPSSKEKTGSLQYLNDANEVIFTLHFTGLGAKSISVGALSANASAAQTVRAQLYMRSLTLAIGPAAVFA